MSFDPRTYWEQRLSADPSLGGVGHIALGEPFNRWMYAIRCEVVGRAVRRHLPDRDRARILDVGSGTGFYLRLWQELGFARIDGSDLTQVVVERARARFPGMRIERWEAGAGPPPFDAGYRALSCFDVLFHIVDPERMRTALRQFNQLLAPGGLLFISENFVHRPLPPQAHMVNRTLDEYTTLLSAAGFAVVERRPMFVLMNYPADSRSPLFHRWWGMVERICRRDPASGERLGRLLFPIERRLVRWFSEGPSTEIMVCRKER